MLTVYILISRHFECFGIIIIGIILCEVDIDHIFNLKNILYFPFNVLIKYSG